MKSFEDIKNIATQRKGVAAFMEHSYTAPKAGLTDNRILSEFSKHVFQARFNWKAVKNGPVPF